MKHNYSFNPVAKVTLLLISTSILTSCSIENTSVTASADYCKQKRSSSGGSSQSTKPTYKPNFGTELVIWLTDTHIRLDDLPPVEYEFSLLPVDNHQRLSNNNFGIWLRPEFIQKGGRSGSGTSKVITTFNYLELPVSIRYGHRVGSSGYWSAGFGPYISYGIGGNTKITSTTGTTKTKIFSGGGYKRFDGGITSGIEYLFPGGMSFGINYDHGLTNILSTTGVTTKNRGVSLDVGYSIDKLLHSQRRK